MSRYEVGQFLLTVTILGLLPISSGLAAPTPKSVQSGYHSIKSLIIGTRTINMAQRSLALGGSSVHIAYKVPKIGTNAMKTRHLLSVAQSRGDVSAVQMVQLGKVYRVLGNEAPRLLAKCLNAPGCRHSEFLVNQRRSYFHRQFSEAMPHLSPSAINHKVGELNERVMNRYYTSSGWRQLPGEVGRNGIDGLFVKYRRDGSVKDVLVSESKYNFSPLGNTQHGKQMSKQWTLKKLDDLYKSTGNPRYMEIRRLVEQDKYRNILWRLVPSTDGSSVVTIQRQRITDRSGVLARENIRGGHRMMVDRVANQAIDTLQPGNAFQSGIARSIRQEFDNIVSEEQLRVGR